MATPALIRILLSVLIYSTESNFRLTMVILTNILTTSTVQNCFNNPPITNLPLTISSEIIQIIKNLCNSKSSSWDGINNNCLKNLPLNIIILLTSLFNVCLKCNYLPNAFKHPKIMPIHKPNSDSKVPANYHRIKSTLINW